MKNVVLACVCTVMLVSGDVIAAKVPPQEQALRELGIVRKRAPEKAAVSIDGKNFDTANCNTVGDVRAQAAQILGGPVSIRLRRPSAQVATELSVSDDSKLLTQIDGSLSVSKK